MSGGHFVLRAQTAPHPTPVSPKEKEGTPCLPRSFLPFPAQERLLNTAGAASGSSGKSRPGKAAASGHTGAQSIEIKAEVGERRGQPWPGPAGESLCFRGGFQKGLCQ